MNVNLDKYFDTQKAAITLYGKEYEVDDDYKKVLGMQALQASLKDDEKSARKFLQYALVDPGAVDEILLHPMSFRNFEALQYGISAAMTGKTFDEIKQQSEAAQAKGFRK